MWVAALVVPATAWWVSVHEYRAQKQTQGALSLERGMQVKHEKIRSKPPLDLNSIEFAPISAVRSSWNGQTEPDNVWHGQMQQANRTLMQHHLPVLDVSFTPPPDRLPSRLRQK